VPLGVVTGLVRSARWVGQEVLVPSVEHREDSERRLEESTEPFPSDIGIDVAIVRKR